MEDESHLTLVTRRLLKTQVTENDVNDHDSLVRTITTNTNSLTFSTFNVSISFSNLLVFIHFLFTIVCLNYVLFVKLILVSNLEIYLFNICSLFPSVESSRLRNSIPLGVLLLPS